MGAWEFRRFVKSPTRSTRGRSENAGRGAVWCAARREFEISVGYADGYGEGGGDEEVKRWVVLEVGLYSLYAARATNLLC